MLILSSLTVILSSPTLIWTRVSKFPKQIRH